MEHGLSLYKYLKINFVYMDGMKNAHMLAYSRVLVYVWGPCMCVGPMLILVVFFNHFLYFILNRYGLSLDLTHRFWYI